MATHIKKMKWNEISGVDNPANESPGWLLQKAATEVEDFETAIADLQKALSSDSASLFFKDADEKVLKAVTRVQKHLDENLEDIEDETDEDEETKVEKRGIARLREIFSLAKADDDESDDDDDDDTETSDENDDDDDENSGDTLNKSAVREIVSAVNEQLDPIREAVSALADRTEGLEKHATGRTSLDGQDGSEDEDDDDPRAGLHKAITAAAKGNGKITLN